MLFFSFCKIVFGWFPGVGRQGTVQFDFDLVVIEDNLFDEAVIRSLASNSMLVGKCRTVSSYHICYVLWAIFIF